MYVLKRHCKLGHRNGNLLGNYGFHAPINENRFGFQRMNDKVKDGLVLSDVWRWRGT
jgi:hypothetical protein